MRRLDGFVLAAAAVATLATGATSGLAGGLNVASQGLTPYRTCAITATPATTAAVLDASVRQSNPTTNYGTQTANNVASQTTLNRRLYIRFDLSLCDPAIPSSALVRSVTLRMYVTALPTVCRTVHLFRVTASWTESTITWNNQPFGTTLNNPSSGSATDSFAVGTPVGCENRATGAYLLGANPTADVAAWVAGTAANYGWMLRDAVEGSATAYSQTYSAKNLGTLAQAPQLLVTYVAVP